MVKNTYELLIEGEKNYFFHIFGFKLYILSWFYKLFVDKTDNFLDFVSILDKTLNDHNQ